MKKIFEKTGINPPRKSGFDLSREQKLTCNFGELVPTYIEEVIPGDNFRVKTESMVRMAPMLAPMMHRLNVHMHYFFVPNRLVWTDWEDFITGGKEGTSTPSIPRYSFSWDTLRDGKLADYMGLPPSDTDNSGFQVSALPFRAYQLIYNEYYRDPNLQDEVNITTNNEGVITLRKRCYEKDYFTSSLPWTQRGADIDIPADVTYKGITAIHHGASADRGQQVNVGNDWDPSDGSYGAKNTKRFIDGVPNPPDYAETSFLDSDWGGAMIDNIHQINIDINDLRRSHALQRFLEKQARGGYRYIETILNHFGVRSSDARLQRPEYLGGGKQPIVISEVLNTSATATEPQGDMAGHGISVGATNSFQYHFEEHGYVIGILSVMPRTNYMQGIHKHWLRDDKFDFFWPDFANLGEQEVKNYELYYDKADNDYNNGTFGYQQRYAEYKYGMSTVHGDFRNNLDYWHMSRKFAGQQNLNAAFVEYQDDERPFAVQDGTDKLWIQLYHEVKAIRPMPFFANPKL